MQIRSLLKDNKTISLIDKKIILSYLLNKNDLVINPEEEISKNNLLKYKRIIKQLEKGKPLQYIIGKTNFYGYDFIVNKNVLIPRFETEELISKTLLYIRKNFNNEGKLIDLGCGSGAIGLTLKKECPKLQVTLLDISKKALAVARKNRDLLNIDANIIKGNMLDFVSDKYDIIISNPPYIRDDEEISELVRNNEPHLALYGGLDGLKYYEQILKRIKYVTNDKYLIAFEIGCNQAEQITHLINQYLTNVKITIKKDLQNRNRMIFVTHNCE